MMKSRDQDMRCHDTPDTIRPIPVRRMGCLIYAAYIVHTYVYAFFRKAKIACECISVPYLLPSLDGEKKSKR
jgi:hypothetical protein